MVAGGVVAVPGPALLPRLVAPAPRLPLGLGHLVRGLQYTRGFRKGGGCTHNYLRARNWQLFSWKFNTLNLFCLRR